MFLLLGSMKQFSIFLPLPEMKSRHHIVMSSQRFNLTKYTNCFKEKPDPLITLADSSFETLLATLVQYRIVGSYKMK